MMRMKLYIRCVYAVNIDQVNKLIGFVLTIMTHSHSLLFVIVDPIYKKTKSTRRLVKTSDI